MFSGLGSQCGAEFVVGCDPARDADAFGFVFECCFDSFVS